MEVFEKTNKQKELDRATGENPNDTLEDRIHLSFELDSIEKTNLSNREIAFEILLENKRINHIDQLYYKINASKQNLLSLKPDCDGKNTIPFSETTISRAENFSFRILYISTKFKDIS